MEDELAKMDLNNEPLSKNAQKKLLAAQKKEQRKKETQQRLENEQNIMKINDFAKDNYGVLETNQSREKTSRNWISINNIDEKLVDQTILIRGRVHNSRGTGKNVFVVIRYAYTTIQTIATINETNISRDMVKFIVNTPKESVVDIVGSVKKTHTKIESCTTHWYEIHINKFHIVSANKHRLPFSIEDATRSEKNDNQSSDIIYSKINLDTRLDNRIIDLRTTTNHAIFKFSSGINLLFREFFGKNQFIEIHTPKMISAASEGGANVFKISYFKGNAYLAQSPQLFKQMCICSDFDKVFEIAPVFRAENSLTHRHMTEYVGIDFEMSFHEHYHTVMNLIGEMFLYIFDQLESRFQEEINIIKKQYPFEDLKYSKDTLILKYSDAIGLLRDGGVEIGDLDDISTTQEILLGKLVKKKYNTDFYGIDKFPLNIRPFYTIPDPENPDYSNSYDFFLRGEEILSGSQRINDYEMLLNATKRHEIDHTTIQSYLDAFKHGVPPHAGGGIGLERVVMLYLNLGNIRKASLFPRDPHRITP